MLSTGSVMLAGRWGDGLLSFPDHGADNDVEDDDFDDMFVFTFTNCTVNVLKYNLHIPQCFNMPMLYSQCIFKQCQISTRNREDHT